MADPQKWLENRRASALKKYGTSQTYEPLSIPDVSVGDKVKITSDGVIGTISQIVPRSAAYITADDGTSRMVPLGYLEKVV